MKWVLAIGGLAFVGYAVWQFLAECSKLNHGGGSDEERWKTS